MFSEKVRAFMPGTRCDACCKCISANVVGVTSLTALLLQAASSCQWTTTTTPAALLTATLMVRRAVNEKMTESDRCVLWYACSTDRPAC